MEFKKKSLLSIGQFIVALLELGFGRLSFLNAMKRCSNNNNY
jgi:hypothetical protein